MATTIEILEKKLFLTQQRVRSIVRMDGKANSQTRVRAETQIVRKLLRACIQSNLLARLVLDACTS